MGDKNLKALHKYKVFPSRNRILGRKCDENAMKRTDKKKMEVRKLKQKKLKQNNGDLD